MVYGRSSTAAGEAAGASCDRCHLCLCFLVSVLLPVQWNIAKRVSSFAGSFFVLLYYLPIYFQSVDGVSASESGVRNLPLVLAVCT